MLPMQNVTNTKMFYKKHYWSIDERQQHIRVKKVNVYDRDPDPLFQMQIQDPDLYTIYLIESKQTYKLLQIK